MSLKTLIQSHVSSVIMNTNHFGESVKVWFGYYDEVAEAEASSLETLTALVNLGPTRQRYQSGDEARTDGTITFSETDVTRDALQAQGSIQLGSGTTYPVRTVHLTYKEIDYHIDSVDEAANGLVRCHVVANDKRYTNPRGIDSVL